MEEKRWAFDAMIQKASDMDGAYRDIRAAIIRQPGGLVRAEFTERE